MNNEQATQQQTLQQKRASHAWDEVESLSDQPGKVTLKEYGSLVRSLPAMIQNDGLAPTLAFIKAKGKPHHLKAYEQLSNWMQHQDCPARIQGNLLEYTIKQPSTVYRQVMAEVQAYLSWLKRFVEAKDW